MVVCRGTVICADGANALLAYALPLARGSYLAAQTSNMEARLFKAGFDCPLSIQVLSTGRKRWRLSLPGFCNSDSHIQGHASSSLSRIPNRFLMMKIRLCEKYLSIVQPHNAPTQKGTISSRRVCWLSIYSLERNQWIHISPFPQEILDYDFDVDGSLLFAVSNSDGRISLARTLDVERSRVPHAIHDLPAEYSSWLSPAFFPVLFLRSFCAMKRDEKLPGMLEVTLLSASREVVQLHCSFENGTSF